MQETLLWTPPSWDAPNRRWIANYLRRSCAFRLAFAIIRRNHHSQGENCGALTLLIVQRGIPLVSFGHNVMLFLYVEASQKSNGGSYLRTAAKVDKQSGLCRALSCMVLKTTRVFFNKLYIDYDIDILVRIFQGQFDLKNVISYRYIVDNISSNEEKIILFISLVQEYFLDTCIYALLAAQRCLPKKARHSPWLLCLHRTLSSNYLWSHHYQC